MTEATQSWLEMLKKFGSDLNLPKVDVDKLIEMHRKNLDAVEQSAQVASAGAKSLADKQREIIETAFREAAAMARDFKPTGDPKEVLAKQTEFAKKAFDITVQNTRDVAQLATQTTTDASKITAPKGNSRKRELTLPEIFTGGVSVTALVALHMSKGFGRTSCVKIFGRALVLV